MLRFDETPDWSPGILGKPIASARLSDLLARLNERDGDPEHRTVADAPTMHHDGFSMQLDEIANDRKPQGQTGHALVAAWVRLPEGFEQLRFA
jgi:hypothetical protein